MPIKLGIGYPKEWEKCKSAKRDWLLGFMKRHPQLAIRQPEATSLGRATSFNAHNVSKFFENLQYLLEKFKFPPQNMYNCDETYVTTVHKPSKVLALKGKKISRASDFCRKGYVGHDMLFY